MDVISEWISKNIEICRPQDVFAFIQTLAVLNHQPANAEQLFPVRKRFQATQFKK